MGAFDFFRKYVAPVVAPMIPGVGPYLGMLMGAGGGGNQNQNQGIGPTQGPSYGAYDYRNYYMPPTGNSSRSPTQSYQRTNPTDGTLPGLVPVSSGGGGNGLSTGTKIALGVLGGAAGGYALSKATDRQDPDTGRFDMRSNRESGYGRQDRETARIQAMENPNRPGIGPSARGKVSYIQQGQREAIRNQPFRRGYSHFIEDPEDPENMYVSDMPPIYPNDSRRESRRAAPPPEPEPEPTPEPPAPRAVAGPSPVRGLGPRYRNGIRMY